MLSLCVITLRDSGDLAMEMNKLWVNTYYTIYGCPCTGFALEIPVKSPCACKEIKEFLELESTE